jgi:hypothetical protein
MPFGTNPDSCVDVETGDIFNLGNSSSIRAKCIQSYKTSEITYVYKVTE